MDDLYFINKEIVKDNILNMENELRILFPTFDIIDGSNLDIDTIINIVEKCHDTQFVYLHRNEICIQYFRIVEKVYNIKKIQLI